VNDVEGIRRRPAMYIGDIGGSGLHHMVWEVLANAVDEFLGGRCSRIDITVNADGAVTVEDDGRGMRVDVVDGKPFPEIALTTFHDAPTLDGHAPHEHVGLHGAGLFPVCALSTYVTLEILTGDAHFRQRFASGVAVSDLERIGTTQRTGTRITFLPDPEVFTSTSFDTGAIARRIEELSYLLPDLNITLRDARHLHFHNPRGLAAWVDSQLRVDEAVTTSRAFEIHDKQEDITVEAAVNWGTQWRFAVESFANINRTTEGGTHVRGLLLGLVGGLRAAAPEAFKGRRTPELESLLSKGLVAIVCVRLNDVEFGRPTRSELVTPRVRNIVKKIVAGRFAHYLQHEPELLRRLVAGAA
jgi:DNA gyrase/topoisomerase IV subunit B